MQFQNQNNNDTIQAKKNLQQKLLICEFFNRS